MYYKDVSPYSTGRILRFAVHAKLKIESRDRILARDGPTAGEVSVNLRRHPTKTLIDI